MNATDAMADTTGLADTELPGLAVRAANGDREAFGELVVSQYDFIFRTAFKWCGNREDAEDVAQDVCIKLPRILQSFEGRSAFTSWLYRVVLNAVRDLQRQRGRREKPLQPVDENALAVAAPEGVDESEDAELWDAVRQLPERQRDAVLLVYAEQKSHAEAAAIMGCGEGTVSYHVHEARKALKSLLVSENDD